MRNAMQEGARENHIRPQEFFPRPLLHLPHSFSFSPQPSGGEEEALGRVDILGIRSSIARRLMSAVIW
jgi:hypothetical protein